MRVGAAIRWSNFAEYIQKTDGGIKGFSSQNLWRMRQYYLACEEQPALKNQGRQLSWSHNLALISRCKTGDERLFYLDLSVQQKWTFRELERQLDSALYLRQQSSPVKLSTALRELHPSADYVFKDSYVLDFLQLPSPHSEKDLHHALLDNLKQFLVELGRDFCFVLNLCYHEYNKRRLCQVIG